MTERFIITDKCPHCGCHQERVKSGLKCSGVVSSQREGTWNRTPCDWEKRDDSPTNILKRYCFKDPVGNPLEGCQEFIELIESKEAMSEHIKKLESSIETLEDKCDNLRDDRAILTGKIELLIDHMSCENCLAFKHNCNMGEEGSCKLALNRWLDKEVRKK